jgi:SAM-dependent methyltransferase
VNFESLLRRQPVVPFAPGSRIPWDDPAFSARMLREHLNQHHDRASRRFEIIDRQVAWLHQTVLAGEGGRVLDLGCGPGLYTSRLARLGHHCAGIDFSPASIAYASAEAERDGLACEYTLGDLRGAKLRTDFDLVLMWFGEFNTLSPTESDALLSGIRGALGVGGQVVLELHDEHYVRALGELPPHWSAQAAGLFADEPHLTLRESQWHPEPAATTERYFVFRGDQEPDVYAQSTQAYSDTELEAKFARAGLRILARHESLAGNKEGDADLFGLVLGVDDAPSISLD